jgi:aspartate aminotransferase
MSESSIKMNKVYISKRAREIQGSPIRKLAFIAEARKKEGIKVFHLNIGQPDLPSPIAVRNFMHGFSEKTIEYAPSNGLPEVLNAWKNYFFHCGIHYHENEMIVTTGGSEALIFALCAVCDPGDDVIVFEPFYTNYAGFAAIANAKLTPIPLHIDDSFQLPSKEEIEKHITPRTRAILFCNPSNPTGKVYNKEELRELVDLALEYNLFLISDEVYREFAYEKKPISIANIPEVFEQAILVDSCSKRFNMCGARVGVLATKNKEVLDAVLKFGMARLSVATVEQLAMVPMLNNPDAFVKPMVEEFHLRRDAVYERLTKIADVTYYKPEGAFYIVVGLPVNDAEHFAKWLIEEYDDNNETVLVAPAQGFYATPGKGKNEVRLAFMLNVPDLQRSLEIIEKALNVYRGQFI